MRTLTHCLAIAFAACLTTGALAPPAHPVRASRALGAMNAVGVYRMDDALQGAGLQAGALVAVRAEGAYYVIDGLGLRAPGGAALSVSFAFNADGRPARLTFRQGGQSASAHLVRGAPL